ncbi:MAG TPA: PAS domain-containing protein [Usitatibacter sp.]|nr:PAS domain-containing protein [Usitatibacter sp.]
MDPAGRGALEARVTALAPGLETLSLPACILDPLLRYRLVNEAYLAHYGRSREEFLGRTPDQAFGLIPTDGRRSHLTRALEGHTEIFNRLNLEGPQAGRWVRAHYFPLREGGEVIGVLVVLVDVQQLKDAEAGLADRERKLSLIIDSVGFPITYVDRNHVIRFANLPSCEWSGRTPETMVGQPVTAVMTPEVQQAAMPMLLRALSGEEVTYERESLWPGREKRHVRGHMIPDRDSTGEVLGVLIVLLDIEHDVRLREAIATKEAELRLYTDNIPDAVAYLDRNRRYLFANRLFAEQRGTTPDRIIGRSSEEVLGRDTASWIAERTQQVLERGEATAYERLARMPDGSDRWFHVKAVPHLSEGGEVLGMYVVAHDISEVKAAQEQLAAREEELRFFAENIPEAIAYLDYERGCTFVNNLFLETRGLTREQTLGKYPKDVYTPDILRLLEPHIARAMQGEESSFERLVPTNQRWVRVRICPRRDSAGKVRGFYAISTDIHDLKIAQERIADQERQLRAVIDSIPTPMCYVDAEDRYTYVNDAFLSYVGLPAEKIVGRGVRDVLGEDRWQLLRPSLTRVRAGETLAVERLVRFADGRRRWMIVRLTPRILAGEYLGYYATTSDVHEQKLVEEELRRTNTILSAHFDNTPLAVVEWDTELRIVRWSGQAESIFGWNASETLGRSLSGWRHVYEEDESAATRMIRGLVDGRERHATMRYRNYRKDGSVIWVEWHNSALHDEAGRVISILSLAQDVSSRIQAEERLQYMATHDGLTGLPNSVLLNDRLDAALARARRARRRVGVMFLDLDHFKDVNDTLGHRVGDALLKELARRIRGALRQSDLLARVSGDEFVVMLEDLPDEQAPERVARMILDEVRRPFQVEGNEIIVSGSLGLAMHPEDGSDAETLIKNADAAMYHAKELGRNGFRHFSAELAQRRSQRLHVEAALRRALKEGELELHFQPVVDVASGAVPCVEALLRWHDPERGLVLPQGFIPLAEETGLGHAVGHWVLDAACRQARAWRDMGLGDIMVSVNLSAGQLRDSSMIADLKRVLARTGCEAGWLQLEITETSMVRDVEGASLVLAKLRALGVRIAIDDFGTGFSSLSHLRHLPVDALKIDKAFVADIDGGRGRGEGAGGAAIVSAVIGLARGLGLHVVAEGVEKRSQLNFLAREGCHACQGYLLCPPMPARELEAWLAARRKPAPRRGRATSGSKRARRPAASR